MTIEHDKTNNIINHINVLKEENKLIISVDAKC